MTQMTPLTSGSSPRVFASAARPPAISMPNRVDVACYAPPEAFDRWQAGLRAASDASNNVITVYDVIGYDWWTDGGVTVNRIDAALRKIGDAADVEVHINSPGGDMFEGVAIYNRLRAHGGKVTVKVMGLAASAASIIAMAGDDRLIGDGAFLMIHNAWVWAAGNRNELRDVADWLEPFDAAMVDVYVARTGAKAKDVAGWMDGETWLNSSTAISRGFATGLVDRAEIVEDAQASARAQDVNATRKAEMALCRSMSRSEARSLIAKMKGKPGAAPTPGTPGAAGHDDTPGAVEPAWIALARDLTASLRP